MKKIIWSNLFLMIICLIFLGLFVSKCEQNSSLKKELSKINPSTILKEKQDIHNYYKKEIDLWRTKLLKDSDSICKLQDKIYKYQMHLIKPDTNSSYWYIFYESHDMVRGYEIVKMKSKCFSLHEAQKVVHDDLKQKPTNYIGIEFFYPVSEFCYNEWKNSIYDK